MQRPAAFWTNGVHVHDFGTKLEDSSSPTNAGCTATSRRSGAGLEARVARGPVAARSISFLLGGSDPTSSAHEPRSTSTVTGVRARQAATNSPPRGGSRSATAPAVQLAQVSFSRDVNDRRAACSAPRARDSRAWRGRVHADADCAEPGRPRSTHRPRCRVAGLGRRRAALLPGTERRFPGRQQRRRVGGADHDPRGVLGSILFVVEVAQVADAERRRARAAGQRCPSQDRAVSAWSIRRGRRGPGADMRLAAHPVRSFCRNAGRITTSLSEQRAAQARRARAAAPSSRPKCSCCAAPR